MRVSERKKGGRGRAGTLAESHARAVLRTSSNHEGNADAQGEMSGRGHGVHFLYITRAAVECPTAKQAPSMASKRPRKSLYCRNLFVPAFKKYLHNLPLVPFRSFCLWVLRGRVFSLVTAENTVGGALSEQCKTKTPRTQTQR